METSDKLVETSYKMIHAILAFVFLTKKKDLVIVYLNIINIRHHRNHSSNISTKTQFLGNLLQIYGMLVL